MEAREDTMKKTFPTFCVIWAFMTVGDPLSGIACAAESKEPDTKKSEVSEPKDPRELPKPIKTKGSVVEVIKTSDRSWKMERNGEPFFIKGVGGSNYLDVAASFGANSIRTWGVDAKTEELLDRAHQNGITITVGHWLGHKRHGFNIHDAKAVEKQKQALLAAVRKYKDHPAVLAWGVGNEVEIGQDGDAKVWQVINDAAKAIKEIDPNHPTVIVIAELGAKNIKLRMIQEHCPDIDIIGLNSYDGADHIVKRYLDFGLNKPCLLTEYGPPLHPRDSFGMVAEPTSSEKAQIYRTIYRKGILTHPGICLGGYSFVWGSKVEMTDTYFGQFLASGERLAQAEVFHELFEAPTPTNRVPQVQSFQAEPQSRIVIKGSSGKMKFNVTDPDGDTLTYRFELKTELQGTVGGDHIAAKKNLAEFLRHANPQSAEVEISGAAPGKYRIYAYAFDGNGNAATASVSVVIKKSVSTVPAPPMTLPLTLYGDEKPTSAYRPTGYMGDAPSRIKMRFDSPDNPKAGPTCLHITAPQNAWSGVNWQHPANDWGERKGGFNATGAKQLTFWARGAKGGEVITFGLGGIGAHFVYHDTAKVSREITLTREWKSYSIDLTDKDLSRVKTPFAWGAYDDKSAIQFYLDDIRIE